MELKEINDFKEYMINNRHGKRLKVQKTDQEFFEDTFKIPHITKTDPEKSDYEIRTGFVAEMANGFTEQLIASKPKVYTESKFSRGKKIKANEDSADRIAALCNRWSYLMGKQSHNPFKQTFKYNAFTRGEAWIYIPHRPELAQWEGDVSWQEKYPDIIPVHFVMYDPLVVFNEPTEDVDGQPTRVLVYYSRLATDIKTAYPHWSKYDENKPDEMIDFMLYVDEKTIYAEADKEALFRDKKGNLANEDGRRGNPYGCVPFVHAYSGWGVETQDKAPDLLAYSRTRMLKGRVEEDTSMAADFSYNIHAFAFRHRTLINKSGQEIGAEAFNEYHPHEPGKLSVLTIPPGADIGVEESELFEAPVFAYRQQVKSDLANAYPSTLKGMPSGSSGRQEDILGGAALSFYDCAVENNSTLWAQAFEKALKICYALPDMIPDGLNEDDIDNISEIIVNTKRDDPLESLRRAADGDRKYQLGIIDLETNLIKYQGKVKAEAKEIMARLLVDDVTRNHPVFRELMGIALAREMGVEDEYKQLAGMEKELTGANPTPQFGSQGGQPREGNVKTEMGREMPDMSLGREPRRAPAGV